MDNFVEILFKRLNALEKKMEKYYRVLYIENELDFILNGTYIFEEDLAGILDGNYVLGGENGKNWRIKTWAC